MPSYLAATRRRASATPLPMHPTEMQTTVIPKTVNRLFVTSLVLSGILLAFSLSAIYTTSLSIFNSFAALAAMAIIANHLILYHIAKKQTIALLASTDGGAAYPNYLFGLPNIIFTIFMALLLIASTWMAIRGGVFMAFVAYTPSGTAYVKTQIGPLLIRGVVGYAESCILITLSILYVRHRRAHFKAVSEDRLEV